VSRGVTSVRLDVEEFVQVLVLDSLVMRPREFDQVVVVGRLVARHVEHLSDCQFRCLALGIRNEPFGINREIELPSGCGRTM